MSENLELKVTADTGEAVANLQKTEKAVGGVATEAKKLDTAATTTAKAVDTAGKSSKDAAQEVAKLGEATGSARGMFKGLAEMGGTVGQKLGEMAGKMAAVAAAFQMGYQQGEAMNRFLQEHGNLLEKVIDLQFNEIAGLKSYQELMTQIPVAVNATLRAKQELAKETAKTLEDLKKEMTGYQSLDEVKKAAMVQADLISKRYNQLHAAGKEWRGEMELQEKAITATTTILQRLGVQFAEMPMGFETVAKHVADFSAKLDEAARAAALTGDGVRGLRDTLEALPKNLQDFKLSEVMDGLAKAITSARAAGDGWDVILSDYSVELGKLQAAAEKAGVEGLAMFRDKILDLIPAHEAAIVALGDHAAAIDAYLAREVAAYDRQVQVQKDTRAATDKAAEGMAKWTDATQGAGKSINGLSGDFTSLNKAAQQWVADGNDINKLMVGMEIIHLSVARASDEATAALYRQLEATKLLREEQLQALDVAQGWRDYLANLKEGYDVGLTSLTGYMKGLIDFKTQLLTLFGSVSGEAKKGIEDIIAAIEALMQTAGGREPFDPSYAGGVQRQFDKGKK